MLLSMTIYILCFVKSAYPTSSNYLNFDNEELFEGDIKGLSWEMIQSYINDDNSHSEGVQRAAIRGLFSRWPDSKIPYTFDSISFSSSWKQYMVKSAMGVLESKSCVKFIPRSFEDDYVNIISGESCYSQVGKAGNRQVLSLGPGCLDEETIIHELMHTIGFLHEQSRYDRDDYVIIDLSNVPRQYHREFKKYNHLQITHQNTEYDYASIMHYPPILFGHRVITPRRSGAVIASNGLSETDIKELNGLLNCPSTRNALDPIIPLDPVTPTRRVCAANTFYCGSELTRMNYHNVLSDNTLYHCDSVHEGNFYANCSVCQMALSSYCKCRVGLLYCGHELRSMNFVFDGLKNNSLYYCTEDSKVNLREDCNYQCKMNLSGDSFCRTAPAGNCYSNSLYCGYELADIGFNPIRTHGLYRCDLDGTTAQFQHTCFSGCKIGAPDSSCNSGHIARPST